jgi:hypothetical protein
LTTNDNEMNRILKIILLIGIIILGIIGISYYCILKIDFIGQKDPKIVEANLKRFNKTLLSAEYREGTNYCRVELLDSINIEINVGDKSGSTIINEEYRIYNDTIIVIGGIKHFSNKFLIQKNKLLYKIDKNGSLDLNTVMTIKFNKLNCN